jgi:predicted phage replisome organizer
MSDVLWVKISTSILGGDEKIDFIEGLPEGDLLFNIWIKLIILAGKCNSDGYLFVCENFPYTEESLASKLHKPQNIIHSALIVFQKLKMIEMTNGVILLLNFAKHQNLEGMDKIREQTRLRTIAYRNRLKQLPKANCDVTVTSCDETEIEIEIEKEIDIRNKNIDVVVDRGYGGDLSTTTENTFGIIYKSYENNIGLLSPLISERIKLLTTEYSADWILEAISKATRLEKRNLGYVEGILKGWKRDGKGNGGNGHNGEHKEHDAQDLAGTRPQQIKPKHDLSTWQN